MFEGYITAPTEPGRFLALFALFIQEAADSTRKDFLNTYTVPSNSIPWEHPIVTEMESRPQISSHSTVSNLLSAGLMYGNMVELQFSNCGVPLKGTSQIKVALTHLVHK